MTIHLQNCHWQCTSEAQFGTGKEIHIWKIPLQEFNKASADILSRQEQQRLDDFKNDRGRQVYFSCRIIMRKLFSSYLQIAPDELMLARQPQGKPYLENSPIELEFNLSHSGEMILLAVSRDLPVGLDVEATRPVKNWQQIARKVFPADMLETLELSSEPESAFIDLWTAFESRQKLVGVGVFGSHKHIENADIDTVSFNPGKGFRAALAFHHPDPLPKIRFYQYET